VQRAHKIELKPTCGQERYFRKACGTARFVYNWALAAWNSQYEAGGKPSGLDLKKQFNEIKYQEFPWIAEIHRDAHSQPFQNLQRGFSAFFRGTAKRPVFKRKGQKDSFYVANDKFRVDGRRIHLPVLGWVKMTEALRFQGKRQGAVVSRVADRWYVSISMDAELPETTPGTGSVGVDLGIKASITLSTGQVFRSPKPLKKQLRKLRRVQRQHSRKAKGSRNRVRSAKRIAKIHWRIANIHKDFLHKATTIILRENKAVVIEDLLVAGMVRNRKLARHVSEEAFGEMRRQLEYKAAAFGAVIHVVNRWFPSSKTCSNCGQVKPALKLSQRMFECDACGLVLDRDLNAARNLVQQLPAASREVMPVDCPESGASAPVGGTKQELCRAHRCAQER